MIDKSMEKSALYQYRSVQKCLSEGISFLTDHFLRFLWLTLPVSVPFALVVAALVYLACDVTVVTDEAMLKGAVCVLSALTFVLSAVYVALIYRLLKLDDKGYDMKHLSLRRLYSKSLWPMVLKSLVVFLLLMLAEAVFCVAAQYVQQVPTDDVMVTLATKIVGIVVIVLVAVAVLTPASLCLPGALLGKEGSFFRNILMAYQWGWRRWGKVFSLNLLVGLIVGVVSTLLFAPAIVVGLMQRNATLSIMGGDAVDLPSSFGVWVAVVFVVSAFIYTLLLWLQHVPTAYQYVTAKVSVDEEQSQKKPMI